METKSKEVPAYRIFVGSIPGQIDPSVLQDHFQTFGSIASVRMFYKNPSSQVNKGYCHITAGDRQTFEAILRQPVHLVGDRRLVCSAHISGRKLVHHNNLSNHKRVIVRGVPSTISDQDLYSIFGQFGRVSLAYVFELAESKAAKYNRSSTASVQFEEEVYARAIVRRKYVWVQKGSKSYRLSVQPFVHNPGEQFETSQDLEAPAHAQTRRRAAEQNSSESSQNQCLGKEAPIYQERWSGCQPLGPKQVKWSAAGPRKHEAQVKLRALPIFHLSRPDKKAYHKQSQGHRLPQPAESNLRFNQPTKAVYISIPEQPDSTDCQDLTNSWLLTRTESGRPERSRQVSNQGTMTGLEALIKDLESPRGREAAESVLLNSSQ